MLTFTDPKITDAVPPGAGETNINKSLHMQEVRNELMKASLFCPHLDERPLKCASGQSVAPAANGENVLLDVNGSGCIRTIWLVAHIVPDKGAAEGGRIKVYVDNEATPRVDCTWREWAFALDAQPFMSDHMGLVAPGTSFTFPSIGTYRHTPIPFHSRIRVVFTSAGTSSADGRFYFQVAYNHSTTVDFSYGRYKFFNAKSFAATAPIVGGAGPDYSDLLDVSKRGALYGLYLHQSFTDDTLIPLEADLDVFVNGESTPSYRGTGTEDVPLHAYYFQPWAESAPVGDNDYKNPAAATRPLMLSRTQGATHLELRAGQPKRAGMYRYWDISPIPFESRAVVRWHHVSDVEAVGLRSVVLYYTET
jgi:hypothetical protein